LRFRIARLQAERLIQLRDRIRHSTSLEVPGRQEVVRQRIGRARGYLHSGAVDIGPQRACGEIFQQGRHVGTRVRQDFQPQRAHLVG
jgi:hypothetical protein